MDYNKTRIEAEHRKAAILERQQRIPEEIKKLSDEMERNKRELIGIEQVLDGLSFMDSDGPPPFESWGLTDSVRKILSDTTLPLVPTQIRDALEARGITGSTSKNLLINVHKVLERIEDELDNTTTAEGKTAYKRKESWSPYGGYFPAISNVMPPIANPVLSQLEALSAMKSKSSTPSPTRRPIRPMRRGMYARRLQPPKPNGGESGQGNQE